MSDKYNPPRRVCSVTIDICVAFSLIHKIINGRDKKIPEWKAEEKVYMNELKEEVMRWPTDPKLPVDLVSDETKLYFLIATRDHLDIFRMLQQHLQVDFNNTFTTLEDYNETLKESDCDLPSICAFTEELNLLHISCWNGWYDLAKELLENHAVDVNAQDELGNTPLMIVLGSGKERRDEITDLLLNQPKIDLDFCDNGGLTAAFYIFLSDIYDEEKEDEGKDLRLKMMKKLVRHGADITKGQSILSQCATDLWFNIFDEVRGMIILGDERTERVTPEMVQFLVEAGCCVTKEVAATVRLLYPDLVPLCEARLHTPPSLQVLARAAVRRRLAEAARHPSSDQTFLRRIEQLQTSRTLPTTLVKFINCEM